MARVKPCMTARALFVVVVVVVVVSDAVVEVIYFERFFPRSLSRRFTIRY